MLNKILVPLDGSTLAACVLPHVVALANATDAAITLLHVVDQQAGDAEVNAWDWQFARVEADLYLDEIKAKLMPFTTREPECRVLAGHAADRIAGVLLEDDIDLIVLSSHGSGGLHNWSIGGAAQKVISNAHKSILLIRADKAGEQVPAEPLSAQIDDATHTIQRYQRILAPLDGSRRAECVLPVASAIVEAHNAELMLVHVVARPTFFQRTPLTAADQELSEQLVARNVEQATVYLEELRTRLSPAPNTQVQVGDCVPEALHSLINEQQCDLIVLSAHGCAGNNQFPYGDTVANLIAYGQTPLLICQDQPVDRSVAAPKTRGQHRQSDEIAAHGASGYDTSFGPQNRLLRTFA